MQNEGDRVLVVAPAFNEAGKIERVVRAVLAVTSIDDILVVDDCSTDDTSEAARAAGALVVRHSENQGVGAAIRTGIVEGGRRGYTIIAIISGDDQHDASELPRIIGPVAGGVCDICVGSRFLAGGTIEGRNRFRESMIRAYSLVFSLLTGLRLTDATNGLRAFRADLFEQTGITLDQGWLNRYELEPYILYQAARRGLRVEEVPCTVRYHAVEEYTKMVPLLDWWKLLRPLVFLRLGLKR